MWLNKLFTLELRPRQETVAVHFYGGPLHGLKDRIPRGSGPNGESTRLVVEQIQNSQMIFTVYKPLGVMPEADGAIRMQLAEIYNSNIAPEGLH